MRDTPVRSSGPLLRHALDGFQQEEELLGVQEHRPSKTGGENRPSLLRAAHKHYGVRTPIVSVGCWHVFLLN